MKKNVNISSSHKPGKKTQIMLDNFSDLAGKANEKLIDKVHIEKKKEVVKEITETVEKAIKMSDEIPLSRSLLKLIRRLDRVVDDLHEYMNEKM